MSIRQKQPKPLKYSDAGVDIDAGDALIGDIAPTCQTYTACRRGVQILADLAGYLT